MKLRNLTYIFFASILLTALTFSGVFFAKTLILNKQLKTEPAAAAKVRRHFILIPEERDNPYWALVHQGAESYAKSHHIALEFEGPLQTDENQRIDILKKAIASRVDGIITQGIDRPEFKQLVEKAESAGIPVVTVDTDEPNSGRIAYVGTDNHEAGRLAGVALAEDLDKKARVAIITGSLTERHQKQRVEGFKEALADYPGIKILAIRSSDISRIKAAEKTYEILQQYPDVTAFYGTSALDALGIAAAAGQFGKTDLYVEGFDILPETLDLLDHGEIDATVMQRPYEMGRESVKILDEYIARGGIPETVNHTETKVLHKKDLPIEKSGAEQ